MKPIKINIWQFIAGLFILLCLFSCSASKMIQKAYDKDPVKVAEFSRKVLPCIDGKTIPGDSTAYKNYILSLDSVIDAFRKVPAQIVTITKHDADSCPDLNRAFEKEQVKNEMLQNQIDGLLVLLKHPAPPIHDTTKVLDSAFNFLSQKEVEKWQHEAERWEAQAKKNAELWQEQKDAKEKKQKTIFKLWLVIAALSVPWIIKAVKMFK